MVKLISEQLNVFTSITRLPVPTWHIMRRFVCKHFNPNWLRVVFQFRDGHTDQSKKKALFPVSPLNHPCAKLFVFSEKNKNHLFRWGFAPRHFAKKLRESSRSNSATFRGETPGDLAEKLREISRWVNEDLRFLHADSEDWSDGGTEQLPNLILVSTRGVIKPTQNRYVPNIITGCAAIGEEQYTCNCDFIF